MPIHQYKIVIGFLVHITMSFLVIMFKLSIQSSTLTGTNAITHTHLHTHPRSHTQAHMWRVITRSVKHVFTYKKYLIAIVAAGHLCIYHLMKFSSLISFRREGMACPMIAPKRTHIHTYYYVSVLVYILD